MCDKPSAESRTVDSLVRPAFSRFMFPAVMLMLAASQFGTPPSGDGAEFWVAVIAKHICAFALSLCAVVRMFRIIEDWITRRSNNGGEWRAASARTSPPHGSAGGAK